jgi:hypothetical protein
MTHIDLDQARVVIFEVFLEEKATTTRPTVLVGSMRADGDVARRPEEMRSR